MFDKKGISISLEIIKEKIGIFIFNSLCTLKVQHFSTFTNMGLIT